MALTHGELVESLREAIEEFSSVAGGGLPPSRAFTFENASGLFGLYDMFYRYVEEELERYARDAGVDFTDLKRRFGIEYDKLVDELVDEAIKIYDELIQREFRQYTWEDLVQCWRAGYEYQCRLKPEVKEIVHELAGYSADLSIARNLDKLRVMLEIYMGLIGEER